MAKKYIDADNLIQLLEREAKHLDSRGFALRADGIQDAIMDIYDAEPADVRENVHGEWIHYDGEFDYDFECSECGYSVWDNSNFCPNCGCSMKGEYDG